MHHSKYVLLHALMLSMLVVTVGSPLRAAGSEWDDLSVLKPGQQIRVVLNDAQSHQGTFQALNDEGITLRQAAGEQAYARKDVLRVYSLGKNHRVRNLVIGTAIGAALAALAVKANHMGENTGIRDIGWVWPVGMGFFGGIGAAMPTGRWDLVYRARRRRQSATGEHRPHASG